MVSSVYAEARLLGLSLEATEEVRRMVLRFLRDKLPSDPTEIEPLTQRDLRSLAEVFVTRNNRWLQKHRSQSIEDGARPAADVEAADTEIIHRLIRLQTSYRKKKAQRRQWGDYPPRQGGR